MKKQIAIRIIQMLASVCLMLLHLIEPVYASNAVLDETITTEIVAPVDELEAETAEADEESPAEITFDAASVRKRSVSYTALSDLHGISVFQNSFLEKEIQYKEAQKLRYETIEKEVLNSEQITGQYEEWVDLVLKTEDIRIVKEEYRPTTQKSNLWIWLASIFFSISLLTIALMIDDIRKKRREKLENHRNRYHTENRAKF